MSSKEVGSGELAFRSVTSFCFASSSFLAGSSAWFVSGWVCSAAGASLGFSSAAVE